MDTQTNEPPFTPAGMTFSDVLLLPSEPSSPWFLGGPIFSNMVLEDVHMDYQEGPIVTSIFTLQTNRSGNSVQSREREGWESQYEQTACPTYESSDQNASIYPKAFLEGAAETACESKSKKFCHCSRSQCLKLYCECFANGVMCSNCHNNAEHAVNRRRAVKSRLARAPGAFGPGSGEANGWRSKGCTCKRSSCLKNYCECYEANTMCSSRCKCVGCGWKLRQPPETGRGETIKKDADSASVLVLGPAASAITPAVVEGVCSRLLAQAGKAEREAQRAVLSEFGHCLAEIIKTMFK